MIRTIFVPIEISKSDDTVIRYAIEIARQFDARLVFLKSYLMAVHTYPTGALVSSIPPVQEIDHDEEEMRRDKLNELVSSYPELQKVEFELKMKPGEVVDHVTAMASENEADLILIGTSGASGFDELFGSIAEKLSRESSCPVIVVPDNFEYRKVRRLAVAIDADNEGNELPLDTLYDYSRKFQTSLEIVNVSESMDDVVVNRNKIYQRMLQELGDEVNEYTIRILTQDDEEKALKQYIDKNHIDMLAIIYRDHGFFKRIFNPGLTKKLVFHTDIPLMVLK